MQFDTYESLLQISNNKTLDQELENALNLEPVRIITNEAILDVLSFEEAKFLESEGFTLTKFTEENPYGTYALGDLKKARILHRSTQISLRQNSQIIYRLEKNFNSGFSVLSEAPTKLSQEEINKHGFYNIPTHAQVVSTFSAESDNQWQSPVVIPSGRHINQSLNTSNQYAQAGFEGMIAITNSKGEVHTFRPLDNAKRLQDTCRGLCIPEVPLEIFIESIKTAVIANRSYLPTLDSNAKMYIRPFVQGINGGSGVAPATSYLFCVEVFPCGGYFDITSKGLDLVAVTNSRRSTEGGAGKLKFSGNYAPTMLDQQMAKTGSIVEFPGKKFHGVFYMGDYKYENLEGGSQLTREVLEEGSAGCIILFKKDQHNTIFFTPSLERQTILPSITRASILDICKDRGHTVIETNISFDMIKEMSGAMLIGTAAGAVKINSLSYKSEQIQFSNDSENRQVFESIYKTLNKLRRGNTDEFAHNTDIRNWPLRII